MSLRSSCFFRPQNQACRPSSRRSASGRAALAATVAAALAIVVIAAFPAFATDVDGPGDCTRQIREFGDAPEGVVAYPSGVIGGFPTCLAPGPVATQVLPCPPPVPVPPPGPAGYVNHMQFGMPPNYWLGCYPGPMGIDSEPDGKTNSPAIGISACSQLPTDCIEPAFGMAFDQDECFGDGSDAGVAPPVLVACTPGVLVLSTSNCGQPRQVFLNVCLDMNADGDWTDTHLCPAGACASEWAIVNFPFLLPPGCATLTTPTFLVGPFPGPGWLRVSISSEPMPPSYPWNGTAGNPSGFVQGGETEDYPVLIDDHVGVEPRDWGAIKQIYR
jgi:hypothetical protein